MKFLPLLCLFIILFSLDSMAQSKYRTEQFNSKLFSEKDKAKLKEYFADEFLQLKRSDEIAQNGKKFFVFLITSMAEEIRKENKSDPFREMTWPDPLDFLDDYILDLEKETH